jgi:tetratricopeptide (TPR) repeat protein
MLKPKKSISKISKKDLKEDKFVKFTLQTKSYLDENSKQVFYMVSGILILVIAIIVFVYIHNENVEEARGQLGIAQVEYSNLNYDRAVKRLEKLIENYSGTDEADQGMFLLANILYQKEKFDEAKAYFEQFVDSYSGSNILLASGIAGLAACYEKEENFLEAAETYSKAASTAPDFVEADNYLYLAGICFNKAGEVEKAIEKFEFLVENNITSTRVNDAKAQLVKLKNNS